jgi:hypothetical protein
MGIALLCFFTYRYKFLLLIPRKKKYELDIHKSVAKSSKLLGSCWLALRSLAPIMFLHYRKEAVYK